MKCIICSCETDNVEEYCDDCLSEDLLSDDLDIILEDDNSFSLIVKR